MTDNGDRETRREAGRGKECELDIRGAVTAFVMWRERSKKDREERRRIVGGSYKGML